MRYVREYNQWYCDYCHTYYPMSGDTRQPQNYGGQSAPVQQTYPTQQAMPTTISQSQVSASPGASYPIANQPQYTPSQPSSQYGYRQAYLPKKEKGRKGFVILTVLLTIALLATGLWGMGLKNSYDKISAEHSQLQNKYNNLNESDSQLNSEYDNLNSRYSSLVNSYNNLYNNYSDLNNQYQSLEAQYSLLQDNYNGLSSKYEKETTMRTGNLLETFYKAVREKYFPSDESKRAGFAAELAGHSLGRNYWSDIDNNEFYPQSKESYGYYTHSYTEAKRELTAVYKLIGISSGDSQVTKINKILNFINVNIHGEDDVYECYHAPMETITLKSGDCDDYSILVGSLFEMAGIKTAIALNDPNKNNGHGHAFLVVQVKNTEGKLAYYYDDLTDKGLSSGKWYAIEPQVTLNNQHEVMSKNKNRYTVKYAAEI